MNAYGELSIDDYKNRLYKFMYRLDRAFLFCYPHKFKDSTNAKIPFTKVDLNPSDFSCYDDLVAYLLSLFNDAIVALSDFNISRIDIAADMEDVSISTLLSILNIKRIKSETLNIYKTTIYGGSDPKIRIYDKVKEIKARSRKGNVISSYEREIIESGKNWIRFEIQIRSPKLNLQDLPGKAASLASYFDRLEFIQSEGSEPQGIMHFMYRLVNRKYRKQIEQFMDTHFPQKIQERYVSDVTEWLRVKEPF